jgi:hypothetical protein
MQDNFHPLFMYVSCNPSKSHSDNNSNEIFTLQRHTRRVTNVYAEFTVCHRIVRNLQTCDITELGPL